MCPFQIRTAKVKNNAITGREITVIRVMAKHCELCTPGLESLRLVQRASTSVTKTVCRSSEILSIANLMKSTHLPTRTLRDLIRPHISSGQPTDAMFIYNFRIRMKKIVQDMDATNSPGFTRQHVDEVLGVADFHLDAGGAARLAGEVLKDTLQQTGAGFLLKSFLDNPRLPIQVWQYPCRTKPCRHNSTVGTYLSRRTPCDGRKTAHHAR
jgi:hypothetical protein